MLNIIVDENIVFAKEAFALFGNVTLLSGREINNSILKDADILIVRSITKVDKELLKNTPVKFVGTATIGTDHIDLEYLKKNKIAFADAKGCNAYSVAEYLVVSLLNLSVRFNFTLKEKSIGIVGVGNVGSKVAKFADALGMKVLLNDPPLQRAGNNNSFVSLDEILNADIITLHVPLNLSGIDRTYHLFDKKKLMELKDGTILINTSRGAVIKNQELLEIIDTKKLKVVLDVWENEPDINIDLLNKVIIGTPHIAGYSLEGKINGTKMIFDALADYLNLNISFNFTKEAPKNSLLSFEKSETIEKDLDQIVSKIYPIQRDDKLLRKMLNMSREERIKYFDLLRKDYPIRREFNNYRIELKNFDGKTKNILTNLRFNIS
ncbi:MAG TPA: 4-phosphoerythronate dehydrogenase [Ignavibacteriaceae bacterium]|nr:4-phosphoerythronate dehydrogenase [Ignavibacteriaceae bacterium]